MPTSFTVIEIRGNLGKHKLKLTYHFAFEPVRMRTVVKFLNHLLPQSCWSIMVFVPDSLFFITFFIYFWEPNGLHL